VYDTILVEREGAVATLTLNRPEKRNAYTPQMGEEIVAAFRALREEEDVRVVILTGAGQGFCAGVDLEVLSAMRAGKTTGTGPRLGEEEFVNAFPLELLEYPKPVIAAIHGAAIGVGVTMSLPCDIRVAGEGARLGLTFTKLGILPGLGSTHLLPRIIGLAKAQELVLTARVVQAAEALEIGLVNRVVPDASLVESAREIADAIVECDPIALRLAKRALQHGAVSGMAEAMAHEKAASAALREERAERTA